MKTITITVVCFLSICAAAYSQNKPEVNNKFVRGENFFPVTGVDITNPQSVILYNFYKENKLVKTVSDVLSKLNNTYFFIVPVSYYSKEKKYNLIN